MITTLFGRPNELPPKTPEQIEEDAALRRRYAEASALAGFVAVLNNQAKEYPIHDKELRAELHEEGASGQLTITQENIFQLLDRFLLSQQHPDLIPDAAKKIERPILFTGPVGPVSDTIQPTN